MFSKWRERLRYTVGFRLALWYAAVFVTSSVALVALTYWLLATSLRRYDRETIEAMLIRYAAAYTRGGPDELTREITATQVASPSPGPVFVRTMDARRDVLFVTIPEAFRRFDLSQLAGREQAWVTVRTADGSALEVASVRLPDGTLFQVGKSTEARDELLRRFRRVFLIDFASILIIGLAGGALLTWSGLQPLRTLADTIRQIMRTGRTDARVPVQNPDDALGELSVLVNAMLDRIDAVVSGMRGSLDNVAHDLRTPMTRLRGIAERALASNDPMAAREALADVLEESDHLVQMLHTLMDISEAETGTMALDVENANLVDLVGQTVELYEDLAEERGVTLETRVIDDVWAPVDRNRIRQVLANLVDNAIKYTPSGGRVVISARREAGDAVVIVTDTGVGIPNDEMPLIWDRLYRGDQSRSTRGLGLGLSLVKAIVEAHGGHTSVRSTPHSGAEFEVRLPGSS